MSEPTVAATRAVAPVVARVLAGPSCIDAEELTHIARIIDRETGLPELIEVCVWASRTAHSARCRHSRNDCDCHVAKARAALAKAEGTTGRARERGARAP